MLSKIASCAIAMMLITSCGVFHRGKKLHTVPTEDRRSLCRDPIMKCNPDYDPDLKDSAARVGKGA